MTCKNESATRPSLLDSERTPHRCGGTSETWHSQQTGHTQEAGHSASGSHMQGPRDTHDACHSVATCHTHEACHSVASCHSQEWHWSQEWQSRSKHRTHHRTQVNHEKKKNVVVLPSDFFLGECEEVLPSFLFGSCIFTNPVGVTTCASGGDLFQKLHSIVPKPLLPWRQRRCRQQI